VRSGDLGPAIDDTAKRAYRRRLNDLEERIDRAVLDGHDPAALVDERDALVAELARSLGLHGRARLVDADAEKARVNVTKAIATVLKALDAAHPPLAAHLRSAIRTGSSCAYLPDPASGVVWRVTT
jgi:hypothetical protein